MKTEKKLKISARWLVIPVSGFFSLGVSLAMYSWLVSIHANNTLKFFTPPATFFIALLGIWLFFSALRLYFLQRRKVTGFILRAKMTTYYWLSTLSFIVVFGSLMFYLIFLLESTFIDQQKSVSDSLLASSTRMAQEKRAAFEDGIRSGAIKAAALIRLPVANLGSAQSLSGQVTEKELEILRKVPSQVVSPAIIYPSPLLDLAVMITPRGMAVYHLPANLAKDLADQRQHAETLTRLKEFRGLIFPVSLISIFILAIPILAGVYFVSFFLARNITSPLEKIALGTQIIAGGNLDHRVNITGDDEIASLGGHFNTMAASLKRASQQIKRMERLEAWQEVARRMAHEIKNPLTPIKLSAERLLYAYEFKQKEFSGILEKTTTTIISETRRLENLVNEFAQYARLPHLKLAQGNICELLQEITDFFQGAYTDFSISLSLDKDACCLSFDHNQLKQVLINLMQNAVDASTGARKTIAVRTTHDEERLLISIADQGAGIAPEIADRIFEPYFTTRDKGSGIGLAMAERIILEHSGDIWFTTGPDGTEFTIELPLHRTGEALWPTES